MATPHYKGRVRDVSEPQFLHHSSLLLGNPLRFSHPLNLSGRIDPTCRELTTGLALRVAEDHSRLHHCKMTVPLERIYSAAAVLINLQ